MRHLHFSIFHLLWPKRHVMRHCPGGISTAVIYLFKSCLGNNWRQSLCDPWFIFPIHFGFSMGHCDSCERLSRRVISKWDKLSGPHLCSSLGWSGRRVPVEPCARHSSTEPAIICRAILSRGEWSSFPVIRVLCWDERTHTPLEPSYLFSLLE